LTIVYSAECVAHQKSAWRPASLLPLLVILFIVSYAILTLLVFEQGRTIESQRGLIREMFQDSTQLAALKDKLAWSDSNRSQDKPLVQADPKSAGPGSPAAGPKGQGKAANRPGKSARSTEQVPGKPPADMEDVRRSTRVI
jgi:hypothetical protein